MESIGLRFVALRTLLDQRWSCRTANVLQINRYRHGYIRAWLDAQIPDEMREEDAVYVVDAVARGAAAQYAGIILKRPETLGVRAAGADGWRYVRVKFHFWPGRGALIETTIRQRVLAAMRNLAADYPDWMVTVTYRVAPDSGGRSAR